jgi:hypothetical protein
MPDRAARDRAAEDQANRVCFGGGKSTVVLALLAVLALCAFQYGDEAGLNSMPYAQVRRFASDLAKAQRLARQGNIDMLAEQAVRGQDVRLRGELTDANCYLGSHTHAYDHAFCAKLCVAAGSPVMFISDSDSRTYLVLSAKNAAPLPENVLDKVGVPGVVVKGKMLEADGIHAFAVEGLAQ